MTAELVDSDEFAGSEEFGWCEEVSSSEKYSSELAGELALGLDLEPRFFRLLAILAARRYQVEDSDCGLG